MTNFDTKQHSATKQSNWAIIFAAIATASIFLVIGSFNFNAKAQGDFLQSTDDMVRMVTVRDWMAGQSWYDPLLHRLGYVPGTIMHWSRLIDLPIRLLIDVGNFFKAGAGEPFAAVTWPFITFVAAFAAILTAVRRVTGSSNLIPSFIVGGFSLFSWGAFVSGAIDHHNVQAVLALWLVTCLLPSKNDPLNLTFAGVITSVSLAIGLEALPIAMAGAIAMCVRLFLERDAFYPAARRYGISLALSMLVLFLLLIGPQYYATVYCDSLSVFQFVCAGVGGLVLFASLSERVRPTLPAPYISAPILAGLVVLGIAVSLFPQCLADPTAIDPLMKYFWLDHIIEAQNVFQIARSKTPLELIYMYALPLIAAAALIWKIVKNDQRLIASLLLLFLLVASAVLMFQVRGIKQATPIAGLILSIVTLSFMENGGKKRPILGLAALLGCCNLFWAIITVAAATITENNATAIDNKDEVKPKAICRSDADLANVLAEKPGFIAAANGLGPWLLFHTPHRVLSGPYHRNVKGNLDGLQIMIGSEQQAQAIMIEGGVTHFMVCPKFPDEALILKEVPNGFLSQLLGGKTPSWLEPIASTMDADLKIWRVRR
jgi:hypothetical protein